MDSSDWFDAGGLPDPESAREHMAQLQDRVEQMAAKSKAVADRLEAARVSVTDPNKIVELTVDSAGDLVDLRFTSRISRVAPDVVSRAVLSMLAEAKRKVADQVQVTIAEVMGADSVAGSAMAERVGQQLREAADRLGSEGRDDDRPGRW